jgi:hypothetical protein
MSRIPVPAILLSLFLLCFSFSSYSQCGAAPTSGAQTISTAGNIVNSYYPGTGNPTAGSTTLTVGTIDGRGSATALTSGDMVLIIQMQGADFDTTNTSAYGDGVSGGNANGYLSTNLVAGKYEYNIVSNYNTATQVVTFSYSLAHNYYTRSFSTLTGIRAYQVIRVPRYYDLTINASSSITAPAWNGSTGGVIVLEAANTFTLNGSVVADALGFRGGGGKNLTGVSAGNFNGSGNITNTDLRWNSKQTNTANGTGGAKGEGIAGTPMYTLTNGATTTSTGTVEGYLAGSMGMGAPGNAGGGGTDGDPIKNQYNPGGGGGGNGGAGGKGGSGWDGGGASGGNPANYPTGGYGGAAFTQASLQQFVMGGGGGAGSSNNSSSTTEYICSGGAGGGIIIIRAKSYSGSGTITANGAAANNVSNPPVPSSVTDAAGGGGAGGTIVVVTNQSGAVGTNTITASATGGKGGDMTNYYAHGPGGGGGGGYVVTNVIPSASITVTAGVHGLTRSTSSTGPINNTYGSFSGSDGKADVLTFSPAMINLNNSISPCGSLPITLQSWTGVYRNNKTVLNWQTDAGVNFSYFIIERSNNGVDFTPLDQIPAADATTASLLHYSYVDASPATGENYYRLKMVDADGQYRYSGIITIRTTARAFTVTVSPNPFTDHVVVSINGNADETVSLRLFNSEGKLVWHKTTFITAGVNTQYFNDLQSLPRGIYYLKINRTGADNEFKLLKQ